MSPVASSPNMNTGRVGEGNVNSRKHSQLATAIQWGLIAIVTLMPFHAFLSVWLGSLNHHEAIIQAWKEVLLLILASATTLLVVREPHRLAKLRQPWILAAAAFIAVALTITAVARPPLAAIAFGLKTDLEFLLAAIIATLVASPKFTRRLIVAVIAGAGLVTAFDITQIFLLPPNFLTHFGYGPDTILPYQHIAAGTNALRFPATLGGPNQLGTYLILPLCLSIILSLWYRRWPLLVLTVASIISLTFTFSRGAWLGALLAVCYVSFRIIPHRFKRTYLLTASSLVILAAVLLPFVINRGGSLQYFLLHSSLATHSQANLSDSQHATSLKDGALAMLKNPFGHGLGTAGPATFHTANTNIIENNYLQIGYETGVLGLIAFIAVLALLLWDLMRRAKSQPLTVATTAALAGVSLVCLVLPAWTDSTTALIVWICAAAAASSSSEANHV